MPVDAAECLERLKAGGRLSDAELQEVCTALASGPRRDSYTLLHVLGRAGHTPARRLVEGFLNTLEHPMLTRIALQVLCTMWPDGAAYAAQVDRFACGVVGDFDDEVRQAALSILGEQVRVVADPARLAILVDAATDPLVGDLTRAGAVSAAARALGEAWADIPSARALRFDSAWARDVLARALELAVMPGADGAGSC